MRDDQVAVDGAEDVVVVQGVVGVVGVHDVAGLSLAAPVQVQRRQFHRRRRRGNARTGVSVGEHGVGGLHSLLLFFLC